MAALIGAEAVDNATTEATVEAHAAAQPKSSEPFMRGLWSAAHRIVSPRTLLGAVQYASPAYSDCVSHFDLRGASRRVAVTIDDAPSDAALMHRTLDALRDAGVTATFFVVANFCRDAERLATLRRAVAEGHELGNHMCDDASSQSMSESEFRGALALCDELIASLDASWRSRPFRWFRPPQGYMASHMKRALAEFGYSCALADIFPLDTEVRSVDWLVDFVASKTQPGSIILLHAPDVRETDRGKKHERQNNADVFPKLFPRLRESFELGSLSDLAAEHESILEAELSAAASAGNESLDAPAAPRSTFASWFSAPAPAS
ncbi:Polysaccharide deacetylase [Aureococcus anophagefferens]|uniref:Polysaccharide deacetylase n=1 Tax=Aureococcus anophagefferens TaxID=44056 RepID=A0ABR1FNB6_AURAN